MRTVAVAAAVAALWVAAPPIQASAVGTTAAGATAADCQGICVLGVRAATHPEYDRR